MTRCVYFFWRGGKLVQCSRRGGYTPDGAYCRQHGLIVERKSAEVMERAQIMVKGIHCLKCGDTIWSRSVHDFRWCKCQACFVDGGRDYLRYGGEPSEIEIVDVDTDAVQR